MYELKADDGNIYGPVDEGNILEWAKGGRIDGNSLVRKTPDGEWLPLNQIEELSYICRQAAESPVPSTPPAAAPVAVVPPGGQPAIPGKMQAISIMTLVGGDTGHPDMLWHWLGNSGDLDSLDLFADPWNHGHHQGKPDAG